eukprot:TRINITY_DN2310_c0_g2_i1.p1 TRINITY_DN2310_c0_g2~~TRINITY_DN2310_c0_g2_i1.p1  ORF type:complete len:305 (+),score=63.66 TRINITY_DN2310_c0_g2_i1:176-1090(+)
MSGHQRNMPHHTHAYPYSVDMGMDDMSMGVKLPPSSSAYASVKPSNTTTRPSYPTQSTGRIYETAARTQPSNNNGISISQIRDVWEDNFEEEIYNIMRLVETYRFVGMDTEYPGIYYKPNSEGKVTREIEYRTLKENVDALTVIQVGLSFADENGNLPSDVCTWQFNFKFDLSKDPHNKDSINLLKDSGLNFDRHRSHGINPLTFGEWFNVSGLALNDDVKWISYHGNFDFAYLLKMLTNSELPDTEKGFYDQLKIYFPNFVDLKCMTKDIEQLKTGGLSKLASELDVTILLGTRFPHLQYSLN